MPQFAKVIGELSSTMRGFTVSFLLLLAAFPALFAGQLADRFGHLRIVLVGALVGLLCQIRASRRCSWSAHATGRACFSRPWRRSMADQRFNVRCSPQ